MRRSSLSYGFMLALLSAAAILSVSVRQGKAVPLRQSLATVPLSVGAWQGTPVDLDERVVSVLRVTDHLNRVYNRGKESVFVYVGYYAVQRAGESIHSPRNCLPGSGWDVIESRRTMLDIPAVRQTIEVNQYVVQKGPDRQLVLYWYDSQGRAFAGEYQGKALLAWQALRTRRTDGALIRVSTPVIGSQAAAEATASDFARQMYVLLKDYLPE